MKFLRRFIRAYRQPSQLPQYDPGADLEGAWQGIDCHVLAQFFASDTGRRLKARLNNMMFRSAIKACETQTNADHARGIATGILLVSKVLDQHMDPENYSSPEEEDLTSAGTQFGNLEETAAVPAL